MIPCVTVIKKPSYLHVIFFSSLYPSLKDKLKAIAKATYTHSRNLAYFVFTYKGLQALQEKLQGKSLQSHSFLAACVGGWLVFGENNNINSQVGMQTMYKSQHIDTYVNLFIDEPNICQYFLYHFISCSYLYYKTLPCALETLKGI